MKEIIELKKKLGEISLEQLLKDNVLGELFELKIVLEDYLKILNTKNRPVVLKI